MARLPFLLSHTFSTVLPSRRRIPRLNGSLAVAYRTPPPRIPCRDRSRARRSPLPRAPNVLNEKRWFPAAERVLKLLGVFSYVIDRTTSPPLLPDRSNLAQVREYERGLHLASHIFERYAEGGSYLYVVHRNPRATWRRLQVLRELEASQTPPTPEPRGGRPFPRKLNSEVCQTR